MKACWNENKDANENQTRTEKTTAEYYEEVNSKNRSSDDQFSDDYYFNNTVMSQFSFGNVIGNNSNNNVLSLPQLYLPPEPTSSSENETNTKFKYCKKSNIEKKIQQQKSVPTKTNT